MSRREQQSLDGGETIAYDHLIVATGATHSYFGHDEWQRHAPGLKTLDDAFEIRARVMARSNTPSARPSAPSATRGSPSSSSAAARPASRWRAR